MVFDAVDAAKDVDFCVRAGAEFRGDYRRVCDIEFVRLALEGFRAAVLLLRDS